MKTTVVPAQITTVEDKIAGSLTLPQIVIMVMAMVIGSLIYAIITPKLHYGNVKMVLIVIELIFFGGLAFRVNGKIVGEWLVVILCFKTRPRRYVFTKNDVVYREITATDENLAISDHEEEAIEIEQETKYLTLKEKLNIEKIFEDDTLSISFKPSKKGGLDVALKAKD